MFSVLPKVSPWENYKSPTLKLAPGMYTGSHTFVPRDKCSLDGIVRVASFANIQALAGSIFSRSPISDSETFGRKASGQTIAVSYHKIQFTIILLF